MDKYGLSDKTINLIKCFFEKNNKIQKVILFGSRAKGNYKNSSDIDFAIIGDINTQDLLHIASEIDELPTPYSFDIIDYNTITDSNFKQNVINDGITFYENKAD